MSTKPVIAIALSTALLSGCTMTEAMLASASIATFVNTDKTVTDHVVSYVSGEDCSILHAQEEGDYCIDEADLQHSGSVTQQTFCYRTIAGIDCYLQEDPKASAAQIVN